MASFEADYLVVGTGASAMAFVDTLLQEDPAATVVMADRYHRPGGHWNAAYSFVRLHTPSAWYGVASRELGDGSHEGIGFNAGMWSLATGPQIMAYFEQVMAQRFLPSGRVRWLGRCEWLGGGHGDHRVRSLASGAEHSVKVRRKLVNATHARTEVPATHAPRYAVAPGVDCIAPNGLPALPRPYAHYTVIGSGKTGMDACLWLLEQGVAHERIRWVMPRDPWMQDRANFQPGSAGYRRYLDSLTLQLDAMAQAREPAEVFGRMEAGGIWMRFDTAVAPSTYRCAIVSRGEFAQLRRIGELGRVVRLGHVRAIEPARIVFDGTALEAEADTLYVDCSCAGLQPPPAVPVFDGDTINIVMVRVCQLIFSASVIAWVEAHLADAAEQNAMCSPVPTPAVPLDLLRMWSATLVNMSHWRQRGDFMRWMSTCRLNGQTAMLKGVDIDAGLRAELDAIGARAAGAAAGLSRMLAAN